MAPQLASAFDGGKISVQSPVDLSWLEDPKNTRFGGVTLGVPWPKGQLKKSEFFMADDTGKQIPVQSWPLAYWPDGSIKWAGLAISQPTDMKGNWKLMPGKGVRPEKEISVEETSASIKVDTGVIQCTVGKSGSALLKSVTRNGRESLKNGRLVLLKQNGILGEVEQIATALFEGEINQVTVEQDGSVRAVIKVEGKHHTSGEEAWLPFVIRFYFYAGEANIRTMHTIIYDGDEEKDFIKGLGVRFEVPMEDELYDRHVRFAGKGEGVFGEAVRGLTGLRRDAGEAVRQAQIKGEKTPPESSFPDSVRSRLHYIPAFGDYTLSQTSSDAFSIRKRTASGHAWLKSGFGDRSRGTGYIGEIGRAHV